MRIRSRREMKMEEKKESMERKGKKIIRKTFTRRQVKMKHSKREKERREER